MAGFFIVLSDETIKEKDERTGKEKTKVVREAIDILTDLCKSGYYSTNLTVSDTAQKWSDTKIKVFADYYSMNEGDYVFFFFDRKIYGIGQLTNLGALNDCKCWSFKDANKPSTRKISYPLFEGIKLENRCTCFFKQIELFSHAVDMDEALTTFPGSFKSIRVIQDRSFIKIDDEEAQALYAILKKNNEDLTEYSADWNPPEFNATIQQTANGNISNNPNYYKFTIESLLSNFQIQNTDEIAPESVIEAALINYLNKNKSTIFGKFDYVTRQVSASPAKPVEYMEWMDIFGYRISQSLKEKNIPIQFAKDRYYVIEIKKFPLKLKYKSKKEPKWASIHKGFANQLMKYIDWVAKNYASGKYSMVNGIIVANDFDEDFINYCKEKCIRNYNSGYRNSTPAAWHKIKLIKYSFDGKNISFIPVYISKDSD